MTDLPRILVVDDDPDISLALVDYLHQEKFSVEVAETGHAALEKCLTHHYDAVLLDVGLPDYDGLEVLENLSKQKPSLPIILLTAFTSLRKSSPPNALRKAFAYLIKPYSREEVRQVLRRAVLGARRDESEGLDSSTTNFPFFPSIFQPSPTQAEKLRRPNYQLTLNEYKRLAENVQLMQFAFDHVPEAILIADTSKRFRFANQAACQLLGYSKEEMEALRIPDIAPNHENQRYQEHLNELRRGETHSYYTTHRTKQGQDIPIEISVYLLNFNEQEFTCAITKKVTP